MKVDSYEALLDEVPSRQMKHRDQVSSSVSQACLITEDALSTLPDEDDEVEIRQATVTVKLLVTGGRGVGKGALIGRFVEHSFCGEYEATNG